MNSHRNARSFVLGLIALAAIFGALPAPAAHRQDADQVPLAKRLKRLPYKIAWECYVNNNWEIFVSNADGSHAVNITNTPNLHEHYPQVSPDGTKIAYSVDSGEGRDAVRSLWLMDINGKHKRKIADQAREPFWTPDGKEIGFLKQEYPKFEVMDFYTNGMYFYHLDNGTIEPHPNCAKLHHLYNPGMSPNGKWIVSTVHAGMGFGHAIILIEAHGTRIIALKIPGCRPRWSPDGKHLAWGPGDHELATADLNSDSDTPAIGKMNLLLNDEKNKIYHINWSPDGKYVAFSRGPDGDGDLTKTGSFQAACEIVGVYAKGWNLYAAPATHHGLIDLQKAPDDLVAQLTTNGDSNKQPVWFLPGRGGRN